MAWQCYFPVISRSLSPFSYLRFLPLQICTCVFRTSVFHPFYLRFSYLHFQSPPMYMYLLLADIDTVPTSSTSSMWRDGGMRSTETHWIFRLLYTVTFSQNAKHCCELAITLFMVAVWNRETIYIFMLWFVLLLLLLLFFPRLISAVGDWMFTILWHMVWP